MNINKALFSFIRIIFSVLIVVAVIYAAINMCSVAYDFGYRVFTEPAVDEAPGKDMLVVVKDDTSEKELGQILEEKGLVDNGNLFYLQLKLSAYEGKIIPGTYTLNTSMTAKEMMVAMSTTDIVTETEDYGSVDAVEEEGSTEVIEQE